jgi:hypothetical protein
VEWRTWLEQHHTQTEGVWLISFKKGTGKPRLENVEAIEEALCFGWIDSKPNKLDDPIFGDPLFLNPAAGDYHIAPGSAAIDAGIFAGVTTDIDGDPRSITHPAIGADELVKKTYLPLVLRH